MSYTKKAMCKKCTFLILINRLNYIVDVKFDKESVWLNQYQMADFFKTDRTSILKHIKNIYQTGELDEKSTCGKKCTSSKRM